MTPTIAVAIPTIGRASLERTLDAIARQGLIAGDEIWVVLDTGCGWTSPGLRARVEAFGTNFLYRECAADERYQGLYQTNKAFAMATADYVLSHSDDDVFVPNAFRIVRSLAEVNPLRPILFRNISPGGNATWPDGATEGRLKRHKLGGGSLACPRHYLRPYNTENKDGPDYHWVCECLAQAAADGQLPVWTDEILMRGRNAERRT